MRITPYLDHQQLKQVLALLSAGANHWSSGTKIGECLQQFNERHARQVMHGRTVTLVLSDGLDTGPPELLGAELAKIKRQTRRLIWLNPLKGMEGYQPLARGMQAALPQVDHFQAAHNLNSLLALEKLLTDVA